jgi:hypothetical protein
MSGRIPKMIAGTGLSVAALGGTVFGLPGSASAATTGDLRPLGCQATVATVYNGSAVVASASCSGSKTYSSAWSTKLVAGGWSGAVYDTSNTPHYFCDFQTISLNVYTRELYLNATKPDRCK